MNVEICCGDIASVRAAIAGGASRVEICSGLAEGGLTPSNSLICESVVRQLPERNMLLRPRPGDFLYNLRDIKNMLIDVEDGFEWGVTGFVFGMLDPDGSIDVIGCAQMIEQMRELADEYGREFSMTFHRAFDLCRDWRQAMDDIIALGFDTILTSGQAPTAVQGIDTLREMVKYSRGRIRIMAGSGITPSNARIVAETGVDLIHASARTTVRSAMKYRNPDVPMGNGCDNEYEWLQTSPEIVAQLIESIK